MQIPKPQRTRDREYLNFLKILKCTINDGDCLRRTESDPHHVRTVGAGGSDYDAIPLCRFHHVKIHSMGVESFKQRYHLNYEVISRQLLDAFQRTKL